MLLVWLNNLGMGGGLGSVAEAIPFVAYQTKYPPPIISRLPIADQYIGTYNINNGVIALSNLKAYYMPVIIPYPLIIQELSVYVGTAEANKLARIGVFAYERGVIEDLIYSNLVSLASVGSRAVNANVSLSPGSFILAIVSNATGTAELRKVEVDVPLLGYGVDTGVNQYTHYHDTKSAWVDGLEDDPTVTLATGDAPHIFAKVEV